MSNNEWSGKIDAESGCRLPLPKREQLDAQGQAVMERQLSPEHQSLVGLRGPTGIRLHSPVIAEHAQGLVNYFRNDSLLDKQVQEIAILVTARAHDSEFEWAAHVETARKVGVAEVTIAAIQRRSETNSLSDRDALIVAVGRQLFAERHIDDELFGRALAHFEAKGLVELISFMAMYAGTAHLLAAFDMQLPPGKEKVFD
ncbi:MAG: carboxymuconolactone decarboxylase family protein [Pseudomonadota bacterium]